MNRIHRFFVVQAGRMLMSSSITAITAITAWKGCATKGCATRILFAVAMALSAAGCSGDPSAGYTMRSPYRGGIKTVAIPIANRGKDVYRRELEMQLTEAVQKQVELSTRYKVTSRGKADTLLEMTIVKIDQRPLSFNTDTGLPREKEIRMTIRFVWKDLRSGEVIVERDKLEIDGVYLPNSTTLETNPGPSVDEMPYNEDFFQGSQDVINRAAARIVEQMEADWGI